MADEQWFWDLKKDKAVPASERGPADDVMGPYPTKHDAEHWREKAEARNAEWEQADREWEGGDAEG